MMGMESCRLPENSVLKAASFLADHGLGLFVSDAVEHT